MFFDEHGIALHDGIILRLNLRYRRSLLNDERIAANRLNAAAGVITVVVALIGSKLRVATTEQCGRGEEEKPSEDQTGVFHNL